MIDRGLLDTSAIVSPPAPEAMPREVFVSVITLGELEVGVLTARSDNDRIERLDRLRAISSALEALPIDEAVMRAYALLVARARDARRNPHVMDTLIAATALAHGLMLVTRDPAQAATLGDTAVLIDP